MSKTRGEQGVVQNIIANYQQTERFIVEQLYMENELHGPTTGSMRENVWRGLFEMIVPKKFVIEHSVFIIDSNGRISREVDLAIRRNVHAIHFSLWKVEVHPNRSRSRSS